MLSRASEFVIQGMTVEGMPFQSMSWAEHLCDSLARLGADGHKVHPSYARPMMIEGVKCVVVRATLRQEHPAAFEMVRRFIVENRLMIRAGRNSGANYIETSGRHATLGGERRDPDNDKW